jgi:hypothetical protein
MSQKAVPCPYTKEEVEAFKLRNKPTPRPPAVKSEPFTLYELDLFRQWFNTMQDTNPKYINEADRRLYAKVKAKLAGEIR